MSQAEERERRRLGLVRVLPAVNGRTREIVRCPFCQAKIETYVWSRCGTGKLCVCGAILCRNTAVKMMPVDPVEI